MVITERDQVLRQHKFDETKMPRIAYMLKGVEFILINDGDKKALSQQTKDILGKISEYLHDGFFFGYNMDLTRSVQAQHDNKKVNSQLEGVDTRYMWNYHLCHLLIAQNIQKHWCIPLIQGYVAEEKKQVTR